jgi:ZIP family zinc transporter
MSINLSGRVNNPRWAGILGGGAILALGLLSALALAGGVWKVVAIGWVAFLAMVAGTALGVRADETNPYGLVWGYGLAAGAMIASAAMFLVPQAMGLGAAAGSPRIGGIGLAAGIVFGFGAHTVGHRLTHLDVAVDVTTAEITAHALGAGLVIGAVYASMPELGILLGLAIVSHKGPAGYAAARRLRRSDKRAVSLLLPAAGVGLTAIPVALATVSLAPAGNALLFGFAAGVFLHVAMDFLPKCEAGSEIDAVLGTTEHQHGLLDTLRTHAVASTTIGGLVVVLAWLAI